MAADVTGTIGSERVALNNAATEATLRLLLQATLSANKQSIENISKIAAKAGLDPALIRSTHDSIRDLGGSSKDSTTWLYKLGVGTSVVENGFRKLDNAMTPLIGKLMDGTDKASDVFSAFSRLPYGIGVVADLFGRLAKFQEKNLEVYQQISQGGVNFNGSLMDMRMAAQNSYLTLDQFAKVMKDNSAVFANLGGDVNSGAKAFTKLSHDLLKSEAGDYLRELGYTTEQVNQGLASYLAASGGRSKKEMENTEGLIKGATAYMSQLQGLADLTGQNREDLDKEMKERAKNAAFEAKLAQMSPEEKDKALRGMANALAVGGKGAVDAFQSKIMGVPPITKEAQMFTATMGKTNESVMRSAKNVTDSSKTLDDQNKEFVTSVRANQQDMKKFPLEMQFALGMMGSDVAKQTEVSQKNATRFSKMTDEQITKALDQDAKKKTLADTEVANAVKTQKAVQEMGQAIMSAVLPALQLLTPAINLLVRGFGAVVGVLAEFKNVTIGLTAALAAWLVIEKSRKIIEAISGAKAAGGKGPTGGLGMGGLLGLSETLGSKNNPMYVIVVGNSGGMSDPFERNPKGKTPKPAPKPPGTGVPANRAERLARVAEGRAAQEAARAAAESAAASAKSLKVLKGAGWVGTIAGLFSLGSDLVDISRKEKMGDISKEEASKERGGAVGEVAGGAAGGALGSAIGLALAPFTAGISLIAGPLIGAYAGGWLGKKTGEAVMGPGDIPQHALGGIATKPTIGMIGEGKEPEAILPLSRLNEMLGGLNKSETNNKVQSLNQMDKDHEVYRSKTTQSLEKFTKTLDLLNKSTQDMLIQLKDIADYSKQTVSATKSLSGNQFKF